jgi:rSAM/selenodomain-associated transferase 1
MGSAARTHLLVMAKAPAAGRVKTRLTPPFSPHQAACIAEAALADTLAAVGGCAAERRILALDGSPGPWLPPGFEVFPQVAGPLGRRLAAAWAAAGGPGLQIGMDTPQVTPELLDRSLDRLLAPGVDAVLGPAEDGGWWAIGFHHPAAGAFEGVPMSTAETGTMQLRRLRQLGLAVAALPRLRDLDTVDDAVHLARENPASRTARAVGMALVTAAG